MCVYSVISDYWNPKIPDYRTWPLTTPYNPIPYNPPAVPNPPATPDDPAWPNTPEKMKEFIEAYWKMMEAAKVCDEIAGEPDCEDPEKTKLEDRIRELEAKVDKLLKKEKKKRLSNLEKETDEYTKQ